MKHLKSYETKKLPEIAWELVDAIECGKIAKLEKLLKSKPNLDFKIDDTETLLFIAAGIDFIEAIIILTNAGADWFIENRVGQYFIDYLRPHHKYKLKSLYPEKYKEYELRKKANKYNL